MSKIQGKGVKNSTEIVSSGGTIADLITDDQIYISGTSINKTLKQAIIDGNIGSGGASTRYVEIFNTTLTSVTVDNGYLHFRCPVAMTFNYSVLTVFEKGGLSSGSLTIDIKKGSNAGTMTTIYSSSPTLNFATASDFGENTGTLSVTTCSAGDFLRLDVTSIPSGFIGSFQISLYGTI